MKKLFLPAILLLLSLNCFGQQLQLKIIGNNKNESKIIDSLGYKKEHNSLESVKIEIEKTTKKLTSIGYLNYKTEEKTQQNDTLYTAMINLNNKINLAHICIGTNNSILENKKYEKKGDTIYIPYSKIELYLKTTSDELEKLGYSFSSLRLINIKQKKDFITAKLNYDFEKVRTIDLIQYKYISDRKSVLLPKGFQKQINKNFIGKKLNKSTVAEISKKLKNITFVKESKYPEILFTKDSTTIYTYLEKKTSNTFDGYIGFANNEDNKLRLNGYLNLKLENTLKKGEQLDLFWKNDGQKQTTFRTNLEIPYLFNSTFGIRGQLELFKQDSTFQNSKTNIELINYINNDTKISLGCQKNESNDIQNLNNSKITDFQSQFIIARINYFKILNKMTFGFSVLTGTGKRTNIKNTLVENQNTKQFFINLNSYFTIPIDTKNQIEIRNQNNLLESKNYLTNELFRFGGINSIRGFSENNFQANYFSTFLTQYNYIASNKINVHFILDYAFYKDKTDFIKKKQNLYSFGIGTNLKTTNGNIELNLVNGSISSEKTKLFNTYLTINYNVKF